MSRFLFGLRAVLAGGLIVLCAGHATAALINALPPGTLPAIGTEYKISGFNSRLPRAPGGEIVTFDGIAEQVGAFTVNESVKRVRTRQGKMQTWIDFEFTRNQVSPRPISSNLAEDMGGRWRVNLTDFALPKGVKIPEWYMYFTVHGTPALFGTRHPDSPLGNEGYIGQHPAFVRVKVFRGPTGPLKPGDLPSGASNGLLTEFDHFFTAVHDVERGLGVPVTVDGFHLGYRIDVPEPAACLMTMTAIAGSMGLVRRRR